MELELFLLAGGLLCGAAVWKSVLVLKRPPAKVRIIYLGRTKNGVRPENYIRLRSNPGVTIGSFHRCRKGRACPWRKK